MKCLHCPAGTAELNWMKRTNERRWSETERGAPGQKWANATASSPGRLATVAENGASSRLPLCVSDARARSIRARRALSARRPKPLLAVTYRKARKARDSRLCSSRQVKSSASSNLKAFQLTKRRSGKAHRASANANPRASNAIPTEMQRASGFFPHKRRSIGGSACAALESQ